MELAALSAIEVQHVDSDSAKSALGPSANAAQYRRIAFADVFASEQLNAHRTPTLLVFLRNFA